MNEVHIQQIARDVSAGNSDMELLLRMVGEVAREQISKYSETHRAKELVARKMVEAASHLVHNRINFSQLSDQGVSYWTTASGKLVGEKVSSYLEELGRRKKVGVE